MHVPLVLSGARPTYEANDAARSLKLCLTILVWLGWRLHAGLCVGRSVPFDGPNPRSAHGHRAARAAHFRAKDVVRRRHHRRVSSSTTSPSGCVFVLAAAALTASFAQYLLGPLHRTLYTSGTVAGGEHKHEGTIFGVNYIIGGDLRVVGALYEPRGLTLRHAVLCVPRREDITTASGALRVPHTTWDAPLEGCVLLRR